MLFFNYCINFKIKKLTTYETSDKILVITIYFTLLILKKLKNFIINNKKNFN